MPTEYVNLNGLRFERRGDRFMYRSNEHTFELHISGRYTPLNVDVTQFDKDNKTIAGFSYATLAEATQMISGVTSTVAVSLNGQPVIVRNGCVVHASKFSIQWDNGTWMVFHEDIDNEIASGDDAWDVFMQAIQARGQATLLIAGFEWKVVENTLLRTDEAGIEWAIHFDHDPDGSNEFFWLSECPKKGNRKTLGLNQPATFEELIARAHGWESK